MKFLIIFANFLFYACLVSTFDYKLSKSLIPIENAKNQLLNRLPFKIEKKPKIFKPIISSLLNNAEAVLNETRLTFSNDFFKINSSNQVSNFNKHELTNNQSQLFEDKNKTQDKIIFIKRKRKFEIDLNNLNKPDFNSLNKIYRKKKSIQHRIKNAKSEDPFGLKESIDFNSEKIFEEENCHQFITLTNLPIKIYSPNYNLGNYFPNTNCWYNLTSLETPFNEKIKLKIIDLKLEHTKNCDHDFLKVINTSLRFCGDFKNKVFYLNQSEAVLNFQTDSVTEFKGFQIEVSIENDYCKSIIKLETNEIEITSPNYPNDYPDSLDCWTLIDASDLQLEFDAKNPENEQDLSIKFTFIELNMEHDVLCNIDYVELFDLDVEKLEPRSSLGKFCELGKFVRIVGDKKNKKNQLITIGNEVNSRHPYLYLNFKSDKLINSSGFKAKIQVQQKTISNINKTCDWDIDEKAQKIFSPNFPKPYPSNFDCLILLSASENEIIELTFERFILEPDLNCLFDRFLIYEPKKKIDRPSSNFPGSKKLRALNFEENIQLIETKKVEKNQSFILEMIDLEKPIDIICGKKESNFHFLSKNSKLILRFSTDDFGEYLGFKIDYKFYNRKEYSNLMRPNQKVSTEIKNKDSIEYEFEPKDEEVSIDSSYLIKCKPKGFKKKNNNFKKFYSSDSLITNNTEIEWFKDGQKITDNLYDDNTVLILRKFHFSTAGTYKCKYGKSFRQGFIKLKKQDDCGVFFQHRPQDLITTEGEFPILECAAVNLNNEEKIKIEWFFNEKLIKPNDHLQVLSNNFLLISDIKKSDSGYYYCQATSLKNEKCQKKSIALIQVNSKHNIDLYCGKPKLLKNNDQNSSMEQFGKIVGGSEAIRGQHPWQVMFWDAKRNTFCGGTILNERWLITAAHCFKPNKLSSSPPPPTSQIVVKLGKHDQNVKEEGEINTQISEIYLHPQYNPETFDNDLALIQVKDHLIFDDYIQPICLGSLDFIEKNFFSESVFTKKNSMNNLSKIGHVTGWGQVRENGPQPRFMQQMKVPLVNIKLCKNSTSFKVTANMFCAGYGQETVGDACKGDSGGPFTSHFEDDRWYLIGVVSWGEGCGRNGKYGFYTKVSNYLDWIRALIQI